MAVRTAAVLATLAIASIAMSACHDGKGVHTETTKVTITGTPKGGFPAATNGDFQTPADVIKALYAEPFAPNDAATVRKYFTEEFVPGMVSPDGEVGLIDFDYRIAGQDGAADGLSVVQGAAGSNGGVVVSHFTNMGRPTDIRWTVCRQSGGALRIVNGRRVGSGEDAYDLRALLQLAPHAEGC